MAGPDDVVSVGQQPTQSTPDSIVNVQDAGDHVVSVNGQGPKTGFWSDFGEGTGGVSGLITAPFRESIPAELAKMEAAHGTASSLLPIPDVGVAAYVAGKFRAFLDAPDSQPLTTRMQNAFGSLVKSVKERPGLAAGSLVKGLAADPELFFLPAAGGAKAGAAAERLMKATGAGAKAAGAVGSAAGTAARVGGAAAIGGGAELSRELGEDQPIDPGAIGLSAAIAAPFGMVQAHGLKYEPKFTPEEAGRILAPVLSRGGGANIEIHPTADGYAVRPSGETEGRSFATKAEAEQAKRELENIASAYRVMDSVPRGTETPAGERARLLHENPFTPERMAQMVRRPQASAQRSAADLAKFWGKAAASAAIGAGIGAWLDPQDRETAALFGAGITLVPRALPRDRRISIEEAINTRNGLLAVMARRTLQFKSAIDAEVPEPARRMAISLAMENTPGVTLNPAEQRVAQSVRSFFDAMGQTAVDAGVLRELLHDYVSHIVEEDPAARAQGGVIDQIVDAIVARRQPGAGSASGRQFAQHRRYATFLELQEALRGSGLRIKTGDIGEIVSIYSKSMYKTITDRRLLEALRNTRVDGTHGAPEVLPPDRAAALAGARQVERQPLEGEAGEVAPRLPSGNLPSTNSPRSAVASPEGGGGGAPPGVGPGTSGFQLPPESPPGQAAQRFARRPPPNLLMPVDRVPTGAGSQYVILPNRQLNGLAVHRDIAPQLNFIFSARDPNDVTLGLMALNQASKRAIVSFSLFHAKSLFDAFVGAMGPTGALTMKSSIKAAMDQFYKGGSNDGIDALLSGGLQLQMPEDVGTDHLNGALNRIADIVDKALPVSATGKAAKGIAAINHKLDTFTFGTLQTGFKLVTGLDAYERLIKKGVPREQAGRLAASYTNDIYGTLDWFRVANDVGSRIGRDVAYGFFNPNGRRWMQIAMFAPDWTFSTFRAAYKALPGAVDDPALAALHRRYLVKSAMYYLTIANGINLLTAGHSIFSNENPTRIQLGDGRTMQFSKHFMEPFEWLRDPIQTADNKTAFLPRTLVELGTGKEYISAHDSAPDIESRGQMIVNQFLPINAQQGLAGGGAASWMGLIGMPIYGKTPEQKREARLDKKKAQQKKREQAAQYYQRQRQ